MSAYITLPRFKLLSVLPSAFAAEVELQEPGFIDAQLEACSAWVDAQLCKRYATPFLAPTPITVEAWIARIVTIPVWIKRGVNPGDQQFDAANKDAVEARAEIDRAANSETGLFELPLRGAPFDSAVMRGFPRGYSEQSPYVGADIQAEFAVQEDSYRRGFWY